MLQDIPRVFARSEKKKLENIQVRARWRVLSNNLGITRTVLSLSTV